MYSTVQPFVDYQTTQYYETLYENTKTLLFDLLDSPVQFTQHIGGTKHFNYATEPILDILVGVNNLHDITSLDEKRLNYVGFYRLHHPYKKKVMMAHFNNMIDLKQIIRLHIIQMNTPLFNQYLAVDEALTSNEDLALQFSEKKKTIIQHVNHIRNYENQKQKYFENLYKKL
ncbi:GrpB family protein [Staphylococcus sp. NRL 16/872]|uniref:GrpB family protein n=1 Tax=Staphylococcus sp. NRL 16/872 TaxID=2930131 RepID=UPI001FB44C99|nr:MULTISPECIES: GrpB family protein [unclassified Staphylococcus]MCJ1656914.1 GrpB family protein [Staphylococcus sp. NRL 21/187]MCJ1662657.1 GrpB family protein [Staphylococcus sp. NRL 18/288]MCJ1668764.1 GrpB family protein [Staphylococcus sp. NRL 19/737]WEN68979.1 GrpB family protein [Staphylococcus sp. NRL 16/872]